MANTLNFNTLKKQYMTVTLPDEKQTVLMIGTPTKNTMTEVIHLERILSSGQVEDDIELMNDIYSVSAKIMSRNKAGITIDKKYIEKYLDYEDIVVFFYSYVQFIGTLGNQKN